MKRTIIMIAAIGVVLAIYANSANAWVCGEEGVDPNNCITATPSITQTYTNTATFTATPTPTHTPTKTPTLTATVTDTATATPIPTQTREPSCQTTICGPQTGSGGYLHN